MSQSVAQSYLAFRSNLRAWSTPLHRRAMADAYMPIVRGFLGPGFVYYAFVTWGHWHDERGWSLLILGGLSALTSAVYVVLRQVVLRPPRLDAAGLELTCLATNLLMYSNVLAYMLVHFEQSKLIYFVLMAVVFSVSGVTLRVTLVSILTSILTLFAFSSTYLPEAAFHQYVFIGIAASFAAFGMATLLRMAILRQIDARLLANTLEAEARQLSLTDSLTGTPNRRAIFEEIDALVGAGTSFWLGVLDLDGFKLVNDIYGHATGDDLLRNVVGRVKQGIGRQPVSFGRLGGDEFAVLIHGDGAQDRVHAIVDPILAGLREPFKIGLRTIGIGLSAGFSHFPSMAVSSSQLYEMADYALYKAKAGHRGRVLCFSTSDDHDMRSNVAVERALREGDLEDEFHMVFQPQYSLAERRIIGFEALARWDSPVLGTVRPDKFIRAAERSGLMHAVTTILLGKTLRALSMFPSHISMSFNLSAIDVVDREFALSLIDKVNQYGLAPSRIEFEITETAVMNDFPTAQSALEALSETGCKIALDDFGAGNSSLMYIDRLPLDKLKIDKGFVQRVVHSETSREIVSTVIDLCRRLGLHCVLEGVETAEEMIILEPMRPDIIQGYLFGRPMPLELALAAIARETLSGQPLCPARGEGESAPVPGELG